MSKRISAFWVLCLLLTSGLWDIAIAQDTVRMPDYGKLDSLNSSTLQQKPLCQVFLPSDYKPGSTEKYEVLYVLDGGNRNTGLTNTIHNLIEGEGRMPESVVSN